MLVWHTNIKAINTSLCIFLFSVFLLFFLENLGSRKPFWSIMLSDNRMRYVYGIYQWPLILPPKMYSVLPSTSSIFSCRSGTWKALAKILADDGRCWWNVPTSPQYWHFLCWDVPLNCHAWYTCEECCVARRYLFLYQTNYDNFLCQQLMIFGGMKIGCKMESMLWTFCYVIGFSG